MMRLTVNLVLLWANCTRLNPRIGWKPIETEKPGTEEPVDPENLSTWDTGQSWKPVEPEKPVEPQEPQEPEDREDQILVENDLSKTKRILKIQSMKWRRIWIIEDSPEEP